MQATTVKCTRRPTAPAAKNRRNSTPSAPAASDTTKNGGKPTSALRKMTASADRGHCWSRARQRSTARWTSGERGRADFRDNQYMAALPVIWPADTTTTSAASAVDEAARGIAEIITSSAF